VPGNQGFNGTGGSGGLPTTSLSAGAGSGNGGNYGGGSGGNNSAASYGSQAGSGAVRIIWGAGRAFPSTDTGNV
jgi:hypothetical protein